MASVAPGAVARPEEKWHPARLIPTTGIGGQEEQEQRATSSLLAVMGAVPEFGRALVASLGAPAGRLKAYTEVRFTDGEGKTLIPDGAIVVERGKARWCVLVEVKTGGMPLRPEQVTRYVETARAEHLDGVLTISNDLTASVNDLPITVEQRRGKRVPVWHLSWMRILTEAVVQKEHRGISDPDQAWLLGELIAYLDHEKSGAGGFDDMGDRWVAVRDGARQRTLKSNDPGIREVAQRWEEFVQYLCLGLRRDLGRPVAPVYPKGQEVAARVAETAKALVADGRLTVAVRIPDAAAPLEIEADLRTRLLTCATELPAPREGRPKTRVTWLLRQVREAPRGLRVDARYPLVKESVSSAWTDAIADPDRLLFRADPKREARAFRLSVSTELGQKRGKGPGSFIAETKEAALAFYGEVLQPLHAWRPSAPKLTTPATAPTEVATDSPPPFSQPGARDPGEGVDPGDE